MATFNVTTLDRVSGETFTYAVEASTERSAKNQVIASIEAGTKRGDTVYEVLSNIIPSSPSRKAYGRFGELY